MFISDGVSRENGSIKIYTPQDLWDAYHKIFVIYTVYLTGMGSVYFSRCENIFLIKKQKIYWIVRMTARVRRTGELTFQLPLKLYKK